MPIICFHRNPLNSAKYHWIDGKSISPERPLEVSPERYLKVKRKCFAGKAENRYTKVYWRMAELKEAVKAGEEVNPLEARVLCPESEARLEAELQRLREGWNRCADPQRLNLKTLPPEDIEKNLQPLCQRRKPRIQKNRPPAGKNMKTFSKEPPGLKKSGRCFFKEGKAPFKTKRAFYKNGFNSLFNYTGLV